MSVSEILAEVQRLGAPLVLLTGGEPMLQRDIGELAAQLLGSGFRVMIETSGAHALDRLPPEVIRIVDVKTPASGELDKMRFEVLDDLRPCDAAKFVLCDENDYLWAARFIESRRLAERTEVLLSPAHGLLAPQALVEWMLRDRLRARLNLQLHKYVWSPDARRV
jgi:7-carboxy-7-deazaguanine synthase